MLETLKNRVGGIAKNAGYFAIGLGASAEEKIKEAAEIVTEKANKIQKPEIDVSKARDKTTKIKDVLEEKVKEQKKDALDEQLQETISKYNAEYAQFENNGSAILRQRERALDLLDNVENLVNSIANHPKRFDAEIEEIQIHKQKFKNVCEFAEQELAEAKKSAKRTGIGITSGIAVASLAPSAAMWIATTFGVASTGTAISALSGAAAESAALAWLGGGALAAGGGGMSAGTAFLALAGPIGWSIGGATLLASIVLFANKKIKLAKEKKDEIEAVLKNTEFIREVNVRVHALLEKTRQLREALDDQYDECVAFYGRNFMEIQHEGQIQLGTMVNNAKSLAATLGETSEGECR